MCSIWKYPTHPGHEITLRDLERLPGGFDHLNITGGEPTLRADLEEMCLLLRPKASVLEISTNGLHPEKLVRVLRRDPTVKIRISVEGFEGLNDSIRGEQGGFARKLESMRRLIEAGGKDLGFATTFQDENVEDLVRLFALSREMGVEFATSALHNGFQFHKNDNGLYDRRRVARKVEELIEQMLATWEVKNWFRAYLNLGLIAKVLGHPRLIPCTAATDFIFVDPWCDVYACNVRNDLLMGNLRTRPWEEIVQGERARAIRSEVASCAQNCWMVASAKTAMRLKSNARLPKPGVLGWVLANKARSMAGLRVPFDRYVDTAAPAPDDTGNRRRSYLGVREKRQVQGAESRRYTQFSGFFNR